MRPRVPLSAGLPAPLPALLLLALFVLALAAPSLATAHEVRPVSLTIQELDDNHYRITWKRPAKGPAVLGVSPMFPGDCAPINARQHWASAAVIDQITIRCERSLSGREIAIDGLESTLIDAWVFVELRNGDTQSLLLRPDHPRFELAKSLSTAEVARAYFGLGVEHIALGIDHLLFVLGLLLLLKGWRQLVPAITAFTIAHSISLALASLELVRVPQGPVEAAIALSIVLLACEYLRELRGHSSWTRAHPWAVSIGVGLLHGLGFAGALAELGLPQAEIPLALLTFNLGVEAGQLSFVALVLLAMALGRRWVETPPRWAGLATAYGIGSVAAYWFVSRAALLF